MYVSHALSLATPTVYHFILTGARAGRTLAAQSAVACRPDRRKGKPSARAPALPSASIADRRSNMVSGSTVCAVGQIDGRAQAVCLCASVAAGQRSTVASVRPCAPILRAVGATVGRAPACRRVRLPVARHIWTGTPRKRPCKPSVRAPVCRRVRLPVARHIWTGTPRKRPCKPSVRAPMSAPVRHRGRALGCGLEAASIAGQRSTVRAVGL